MAKTDFKFKDTANWKWKDTGNWKWFGVAIANYIIAFRRRKRGD